MTAIVCATALFGVAGCGGTDKSTSGRSKPAAASEFARDSGPIRTTALGRRQLPEIRGLLASLFAGVNAANPGVCRLYTQYFLETQTHLTGRSALARCRKEIARVNYRVSLARIEGVDLRRSRGGVVGGRVQALERIGTGRLRAHIVVIGSGAGYRIDAISGQQLKK